MTGTPPVHGTVAPGFESVREAFERTFTDQGELGAAASAYVDGRQVVDLWGGWADADRTRPWQRDTIATTFSAVKGMTSTCAHRLIGQGRLDPDERVASYWPAFGQAGKEDITVRMVLTHQAGLQMLSVPVPMERRLDWPTMTDALERSAPTCPPGTRSEYHGGTFGFLVGNLIERIDGRPLATYFREEIAEPLGADYLIAVGPDDDARSAEIVGPEDLVGGSNTEAWRRAGDGAATGAGTADGLARVYAALACGGRLDGVDVVRPETLERAVQDQTLAHADGDVADFGLGYQLLWKTTPLPKGTFGHTGMGGSIGLADRRRRFAFGWVMNALAKDGVYAVLTATYAALAGAGSG